MIRAGLPVSLPNTELFGATPTHETDFRWFYVVHEQVLGSKFSLAIVSYRSRADFGLEVFPRDRGAAAEDRFLLEMFVG